MSVAEGTRRPSTAPQTHFNPLLVTTPGVPLAKSSPRPNPKVGEQEHMSLSVEGTARHKMKRGTKEGGDTWTPACCHPRVTEENPEPQGLSLSQGHSCGKEKSLHLKCPISLHTMTEQSPATTVACPLCHLLTKSDGSNDGGRDQSDGL